jgi:leader peptidase (prepilin peptidase)/N-methyltransferase
MEIIFITLFAAIIGSFLNMLIYRLPKMIQGEDVSPLYPQKSFCPHCKHSLNAKDLIPIVSFILCWGKCRYCNQAIYLRYLWTEMISVIVALLLYNTWGWTPQFGYFLILSLAFIILFWTDYETHLIPDIITIPVLWVGLVYHLQFGDIHASIIGAIVGYISLWSVFWIFKLLRNKEGMGYGDFKLFALIGAWFGWQVLPIILFIAAIIGILFFIVKIKDKEQEFAFGTSLILATIIVQILPNQLSIF